MFLRKQLPPQQSNVAVYTHLHTHKSPTLCHYYHPEAINHHFQGLSFRKSSISSRTRPPQNTRTTPVEPPRRSPQEYLLTSLGTKLEGPFPLEKRFFSSLSSPLPRDTSLTGIGQFFGHTSETPGSTAEDPGSTQASITRFGQKAHNQGSQPA